MMLVSVLCVVVRSCGPKYKLCLASWLFSIIVELVRYVRHVVNTKPYERMSHMGREIDSIELRCRKKRIKL